MSQFRASALIFTVRGWRKIKIEEFPEYFLRATENAVADHIWPEGRYFPTHVLKDCCKMLKK